VPAQSRGLAMGAYTAFLDLAQGLASPALGLVASAAGLGSVFLASTLVVFWAAAVAARLLSAPSPYDNVVSQPIGGCSETCYRNDCVTIPNGLVVGSSGGKSHDELQRFAHAGA